MEIPVLDTSRKVINVGDKVVIYRDGHLRTSYVFKIDVEHRCYAKLLLSKLPVTQYGPKKNDGRSVLHYYKSSSYKEYYYTNTLIVIKNDM